MAFMHGAQDGQKFIGVLLLGQFLVNGVDVQSVTPKAPWELMVLCSVVMALGTSLGGYKIIKAVGMDMGDIDLVGGVAKLRGKGKKERYGVLGQKAKTALLAYFRLRNMVLKL